MARYTTGLSLVFAASLVLLACGDDGATADPDAGVELGGPRTPFPELFCPGSPSCTGTGDNVFRVGAARASITPNLNDYETEWVDENKNNEYDNGEEFTDKNGNNKFDAAWIAGFGNGRPATGIHSDVWVRAIVFEHNDTRIGLAVVDAVGWFIHDMDASRAKLAASLNLDHVIIASTHVHESMDTIGLWGIMELVPGIYPEYMELIKTQIAAAVTEAAGKLEPVTMTVAQVRTVDENGASIPEWVGDGRDPVIHDPTMTIMQFLSVDNPGTTAATLVHWAAHPEYSGSDNNLITADFPYLLREVIENGIAENVTRGLSAMQGLGGEVVYVNGSVGGQIGPKNTAPIGLDGNPVSSSGLEKSDALGRNLGRLALETITDSTKTTDYTDLNLVFRTGMLDLAVENVFYHVAGLVGVFDRPFHGYDETKPIGETNIPYIESRVSYLQVGPIGMITAPGELHPELAIGGYDGSMSWGEDMIDSNNPKPPDVANAPQGPYLNDLIKDNPGVEIPLVLGLAEDFAGYIVPSYNYIVDDYSPFIEEAEGDHYEETNSVGPQVEAQAVGAMRDLITWRP